MGIQSFTQERILFMMVLIAFLAHSDAALQISHFMWWVEHSYSSFELLSTLFIMDAYVIICCIRCTFFSFCRIFKLHIPPYVTSLHSAALSLLCFGHPAMWLLLFSSLWFSPNVIFFLVGNIDFSGKKKTRKYSVYSFTFFSQAKTLISVLSFTSSKSPFQNIESAMLM